MSFSSFAKGLAAFGSGYIKADERAREEARQAERDAMLKQKFEWDKARAQNELDAAERDKTERDIIKNGVDSGTVNNNAAAVTYTDASGEQKTAYQPDTKTAEFVAQQTKAEQEQIDAYNKANATPVDAAATPAPAESADASAPAPAEAKAQPAPAASAAAQPSSSATNPQAITASSYRNLDGSRKLFTGLDAATQAKKYADENPIGEYSKYMAMRDNIIKATGNMKLADEMLTRAKNAEQEGAFKTLALLNAGRTAEAERHWNMTGAERLSNGRHFKTITDKDGKQIHQVVEGEGENEKVVVPNVENALLDHIGGIAGVQSRAAAKAKEEADIRKELLKPVPLSPGQKLVSGGREIATNTEPPKGYEDVTDPVTGVTRRVAISKTDKPGDYPKVIADTFKGDESKIAQANALYDRFKESNPGMRDAEAAALAQRALNGGQVVTAFNPSTGMFERHFKDVAGVVKDGGASLGAAISNGTYRLGTPEPYKAGGLISSKDAEAAVAQMKTAMPNEYNGYLAIIKTPELYNSYVNKAGDQIGALRTAAEKRMTDAKTPEERARIESEYQAASGKITSEMRRVALVKEFYKPEAENKTTNPSAKPTATDRLNGVGGMGFGSAVPVDAAKKAANAEAATKANDDKKAAEATAKAKADEQARKDIDGLTPDVITNIGDLKTAETLYNKYNQQMDGRQREAFQQLIPRLRQQELNSKFIRKPAQ